MEFLDAIDEVDYYNKREPFHTILFLIKTKIKHFDYSFCILDYETGGVGRACARIAVEMGRVSIGLEQRNLPNINFTITLKRDKANKNRRHYYAEMLKAIGVPSPVMDRNLPCIEQHKLSRYLNTVGIAFNREKKYIAIAIGAGYGAYVDNGIYHYVDIKNWKVERWILLDNSLEKDGFTPILIGGNAEKEKLKEKGLDISDGVINLVGKTSIGQSLAVVSKCSLLISADSGHIHGAYLVNTPVLCLVQQIPMWFFRTTIKIVYCSVTRNAHLAGMTMKRKDSAKV